MRLALIAHHDDVDWTSSQPVYTDDMVAKVIDALRSEHVTKVEIVWTDKPAPETT